MSLFARAAGGVALPCVPGDVVVRSVAVNCVSN